MSETFGWAPLLQAEPITVELWKKLPEDFCRQVEVVNGQAVRCESPSRLHQKMTRKLANMVEQAAVRHSARYSDCLDADTDFDVILWELPEATIRRPDVGLFRCAPDGLRPLPAHLVLLAVEVISGRGRTETVEKKAEYAAAGIPWYWIVRLDDSGVESIDMLALDLSIRAYRRVDVYKPGTDFRPDDG